VEQEEPALCAPITIELDRLLFSPEAVLKTCYWFSKDFAFDITSQGEASLSVTLTPKQTSASSEAVRADFFSMATDFALRGIIDARTGSIRELLLAKAFSEAGILEDSPEGVFGDVIEEEKPDGLFRILSQA